MQTTKTLKVETRDGRGKGSARKSRAAGRIPGVVYGAGREAQPVALQQDNFVKLVRSGAHHGLLDVTLDAGAPIKALVREIQVHPVTRDYVHVDIQAINMKEKIRIAVPVVLVGKPEGVKLQGGILEHALRSIEVECLPSDIPAQLEVDVSQLSVGQSVHVSDVQIPGVTFVAHAETTIAAVTLPAAERAAEVAVTEAVAAPEAEGKAAAGKPGDAKAAAAKPAAAGKPAAAKAGGKGDAKPAKGKG